jgi:hypothetical protein
MLKCYEYVDPPKIDLPPVIKNKGMDIYNY